MALMATGSQPQVKPTGSFPAVCVDVIDAGWFEPGKKSKSRDHVHKCKLRFYYVADNPDSGEEEGYYADLFVSLSLGVKSILGQFLEAWINKKFTDEQRIKGIDVEKFIGVPALINVVVGNTEGYYDVASALPVPKQMRGSCPTIPIDYIRDKDTDEPMFTRYPKPGGEEEAAPEPAPAKAARPLPAPVPASDKKVASSARAEALTKEDVAKALDLVEEDEDDLPF